MVFPAVSRTPPPDIQTTILSTDHAKYSTNLRSAWIWMALYLFLVALGRYFVSGALEYDEAEQFLHAQFLLPGYGPQPPLFEWIMHALFLIDGTSFLMLLLFKAALLWIVFWSVGQIFLLLTGREDVAVVAGFAVFLLPILSWAAPRTLTHTLLATFFAALFLLVLLVRALPDDQAQIGSASIAPWRSALALNGWWMAALALSAAGALLSKYSMAPVLLIYVLATLSVPAWRSRLWTWHIFAAAGLAGLMVAPHGWWVWTHLQHVRAPIMAKLSAGGAPAGTGFMDSSAAALLSGLIGFLALPMLAWLYLWIWNRIRFGTDDAAPGDSSSESRPLKRASIAYFAMFALLCLVIVAGPGSAGFRNRWLTPFLFLLPTAAVMWAARRPHSRALLTRLAAISRTLLVVAGIGLVVRGPLNGWLGYPGWANLPIDAISHDVKLLTQPSALVLVSNMQLAGSLEMKLEDRLIFELNSSVVSLVRPLSCELLLIVPEPQDDPTTAETGRLQERAAIFLKQEESGTIKWVTTRQSHKYRFSDELLDVLYLSAKSC